ncbi:MAG TPA: helix-turn-helix transcriptional regulator [Gammaproteobacteria bacterium]|nr:helix-turn-helix transcriptional regulator [Gammaproteobacteria bacterium]
MIGTDFIDAVGAIYEAALQPELWPAALAEVGKVLQSVWLPLGVLRFTGQADLIVQQTGGDPGHLALFTEKFTSFETNPSLPLLAAGGPGHIALNERDMKKDDWQRSALYREIYKPMNLYHSAGAFLLKTDSHMVLLGLCRRKGADSYTGRDIALLRQTMPHLSRALQTFLRFTELESFNAANESMWDALAAGVVLLDKQGRVSWANRSAMKILAAGAGLGIDKGRLYASARSDNASLQRVLAGALATSLGGAGGAGGTLCIARAAPARPLVLLIAPIALRAAFVNRPAVAVFVNDPEQRNEAAPELLRSLYGLTEREAALADLLAQGMELREAAERLRIRMHTARTHLKLIFEKTDTHRQAELLHLLLRGPVGR